MDKRDSVRRLAGRIDYGGGRPLSMKNGGGRTTHDDNGRPHYYGPSSNHAFTQSSTSYLLQPSLRSVRQYGDPSLRRAGLKWSGDIRIEKQLTELFFKWHNAICNEVNECVYRREKEIYDHGQDSLFYSPTLQNAILAIGACYTTRTIPGIPGDSSEFFAKRAKTLLEIELDKPTFATLEAISLISSHEMVNARESSGWLYSGGISVHLVTDMGLHLDLEPNLEPSLQPHDLSGARKLSQEIFWANYWLNIQWSLYLGRPSLMTKLGCTTRKPEVVSIPNMPRHEPARDRSERQPEDCQNPAYNVAVYIYRLASIMGKIADTVYGGVPSTIRSHDNAIQAITSELEQWKKNLPPEVDIDLDKNGNMETQVIYGSSILQLQ
ncbi:uncharacterized protein PV07_11643 [Cladophialophora immunda]|uniref:Xylanolytic transcriptional activator regulatory domain-containing protein n=1 Tax=Cladophialophora immunda TaxID=569365 RepID=A0A0D2CIR2_9EURO|nr:uncharacterized protein PV07_11643 [Cladophialophora immunda]KIW23449.1 hypothetical protein PV07_11643 [Cladophialophora immunda]